ncbi:MAG: hypothetical protein JRI79_05365 [Deltaproteobacteria bacterium]|nr:hypothetical protein [Deltaproteobacteria bacterium]
MKNSVRLEMSDHIATLTLNRPGSLNSFDLDMIQFISERLTQLSGDTLVTGVKGGAFCDSLLAHGQHIFGKPRRCLSQVLGKQPGYPLQDLYPYLGVLLQNHIKAL